MKNLLKYIILGIVALAFYNGAEGGFSVNEEKFPIDFPNELSTIYNSSLSAPDSDLCQTRQVSSVSLPRLQNNSRRSETTSRQNVTFLKAGKTVNPGIRYIVQKQSILSHSSLIRPSDRLLYLGQLII